MTLTDEQRNAIIGIAVAATELSDQVPISVDALGTVEGQLALASNAHATFDARLDQILSAYGASLNREPNLREALLQLNAHQDAVVGALRALRESPTKRRESVCETCKNAIAYDSADCSRCKLEAQRRRQPVPLPPGANLTPS